MLALLDLLKQMAAREYQGQIIHFYTGNQSHAPGGVAPSSSTTDILSTWEQRKVFKQCRRSLLLCWKFIIAQLNDERTQKALSAETRETYYQILGLIAERVEFNLLQDPKDMSKNGGRRSPTQVGEG
ncbi:hypothetical protein PINS_up020184 [Pythium insidiosum]|nr:hypothetical protein PINS_up020184 [Pythium insidiosum]